MPSVRQTNSVLILKVIGWVRLSISRGMSWVIIALIYLMSLNGFSFNGSGGSNYVWASKNELLTNLSKNDLYFEYDRPNRTIESEKNG